MLKPSYAELMEVMNKDKESDVTSRYTVVIAAAKRARQLIDGDEPMIDNDMEGKPVSTAVEEIRQGKIHVVPEGQGTVIFPKTSIEDEIMEELAEQDKDDETEELFDNIDNIEENPAEAE